MNPWRCMKEDLNGPTRLLDPLLETAGNQHRLYHCVSNDLLLFSDYSGQDKNSRFETYSFLIADRSSTIEFFDSIEAFRKKRLNAGEHVSYKRFSQTRHRESFAFFVNAAKMNIKGNLITVAVDKKLNSLLSGHKIEFTEGMDQDAVNSWNSLPKGTAEQTARILHFVSLIVSGLSPEKSDVYWISDNDETLANEERKLAFWNFFTIISSLYLHNNMKQIWIGDSSLNQDCMRIEDALTLPDVAAGSFRDCLNSGLLNAARYPSIWVPDSLISPKAIETLHSFSGHPSTSMKSIFLALESTSSGINAVEYAIPNSAG